MSKHGSHMQVNKRGSIQGLVLCFLPCPVPGRTGRYIQTLQHFSGERMFVWILPTGQTLAAVCVCACERLCALSVSAVSVCLCKKGRGGGGLSLESCFQQCSVPQARPLHFAVVTTSKLCRKIATVIQEMHFPAHRNCR